MRSSTRALLLCLLGTAFEGCLCNGSADAPAAPRAAAGAPAAARTAALATSVCDLLQHEPARRRAECCGSGATRHLGAECTSTLGAALERGSLTVDRAVLAACAEATSRERSACDWVTPSQPLPPSACGGLTRGTLTAGGRCRSSLECVAPLHCQGSTPSEAGQCAPPAPPGAACGVATDALAALLFARDLERAQPVCAGTCSLRTQRCEATAEASEPARASEPVATAETCQTDFDCSRGGCAANGRCGMKCAIDLNAPAAKVPALAFRRHAR